MSESRAQRSENIKSDPSRLATAALHREIEHAKELSEAREKLNEVRFAAAKELNEAKIAAAKELSAMQHSERQAATALAFQAAKEALSERAQSFGKQIDATSSKVDDVKERVRGTEGHSKGMSDGWAILLGVVMMVLGLAGLAASILIAFFRH